MLNPSHLSFYMLERHDGHGVSPAVWHRYMWTTSHSVWHEFDLIQIGVKDEVFVFTGVHRFEKYFSTHCDAVPLVRAEGDITPIGAAMP